MTEKNWNDILNGRQKLVASFISANNEARTFGTFRIPISIHRQFGDKMTGKLMFRCGDNVWKSNYDPKRRKITGLRKFMTYYKVTLFSMIKFDYYGDNMFLVKIFRPSGVETDLPDYSVKEFMTNEDIEKCHEADFMFDGLSVEFERSCGLWSFNAYRNYSDYYTMKVFSFDIDSRIYELRLRPELKGIYKKWRCLTYISLLVAQQSWQVELLWEGDRCLFGRGWLTFAAESGLEAGDTLVFFDCPSKGPNTVNTVIFKKSEDFKQRDENLQCERSFFKIVSLPLLDEGCLVVPKYIKDAYGDKLKVKNAIEVFGNRFPVFYNYDGGYLRSLAQLLVLFGVLEHETIILTIDEGRVIHGRIYQVDGKEIDYKSRISCTPTNKPSAWIWSVVWNESGTEEMDVEEQTGVAFKQKGEVVGGTSYGQVNEDQNMDQNQSSNTDQMIQDTDQAVELLQFTAKLNASNVNMSTHGVLIPENVTPRGRGWQAGEKVDLVTRNGTWQVVVVLSGKKGRFSGGWNAFTKDNNLTKSQNLIFTLIENREGISFDVKI